MTEPNDLSPGHRLSAVPHEARPYQGHRAGVVTRLLAAGVDAALVAAIVVGAYLVVALVVFLVDPRGFGFPHVPFAGWLAAGYVVATGYLAIGWSTTGRTPGAHLLGLRVLGPDGGRVHAWRAVLRAAFCVAFPIGLLWVALSGANRSVADLLARTSVVYAWTLTRAPDTGHVDN